MSTAAVLAATLLAVTGGLEGQEGAVPDYTLQLFLNTQSATLSGEMSVRLPSVPTDGRIPLYLYPNLYAEPDPDLNEVNFPLRFPGGFSPGSMTLDEVTVNGEEASPEYEGGEESAAVVAYLSSPPDSDEVEVSTRFSVVVPERFGTFGRFEGRFTLLGGWHPSLPRATPEGYDVDTPRTPAEYDCRVTVDRPGLLALGAQLVRVGAGRPVNLKVSTPGPLLLYFSPDFSARAVFDETGRRIGTVVGADPGCEKCGDRAARVATQIAHRTEFLLAPQGSPVKMVALEAPLREAVALPFPGGVLYSDMIFSIAPIERMVAQHTEGLRVALLAGSLLTSAGVSLLDALVTAKLLMLWRWEGGETSPAYVRDLFRKVEAIDLLDRVGTDPQAYFQSSVYFSPRVAADLENSFEAFASPLPSPLTTARLISLTYGWPAVLKAVGESFRSGAGVLELLSGTGSQDQALVPKNILSMPPTDLTLESVKETDNGWQATMCKGDIEAEFPVEVLVAEGRRNELSAVTCRQRCCTFDLGKSKSEPDVVIDPLGIVRQKGTPRQHPRFNDRNYADIKWMFARPYFAMSSGDRVPTLGIELSAQRRWDLRNRAFIYPLLTPARVAVFAGWRFGFGEMVRPNYLHSQLGIGVRGATSLDSSQSSFGPALTYSYYTRESRTNPFEGTWINSYLYPLFSDSGEEVGVRAGGLSTFLFGGSPIHIVAARLLVDASFGWAPSWESPTTGGHLGLRALPATAIRAGNRLGLSLEYRWMPLRNLNLSLFDLAFLNAFQVALFADSATMDEEMSDLFRKESSYLNVGLGLRPHFQAFGAFPALMSLDIAYLVPYPHSRGGGVGALMTFNQPF